MGVVGSVISCFKPITVEEIGRGIYRIVFIYIIYDLWEDICFDWLIDCYFDFTCILHVVYCSYSPSC